MIWATVSFWFCFCWLYRASPSLVAKNIINLILVLTIWWCPCVESSLVLLEVGVCYDQCILLAKLCYSLTYFNVYSKVRFAYYSRCLLTSYFGISVPGMDIFFWVWAPRVCDGQGSLVCYSPWGHKESDTTERLNWTDLESLVGLHRIIQLQLLWH